jgi:hypothetical protein
MNDQMYYEGILKPFNVISTNFSLAKVGFIHKFRPKRCHKIDSSAYFYRILIFSVPEILLYPVIFLRIKLNNKQTALAGILSQVAKRFVCRGFGATS